MNNIRTPKYQQGQTLVETIIAIFVLTTALTSGLALTVYVLANSRLSFNQLIATNLAREGVEVVRMMRDSNWLAGEAKGGNWALSACADISNKPCYPGAYQKIPSENNYDISPNASSTETYRLEFQPTPSKIWLLSNSNNYNLYLQSDGTYTHNNNGTTSLFSRKIIVTPNSAAPFTNQNSNWEIKVESIVAWRDKKCTWAGQDPSSAPKNCRVTIEEHLTNWKDY